MHTVRGSFARLFIEFRTAIVTSKISVPELETCV